METATIIRCQVFWFNASSFWVAAAQRCALCPFGVLVGGRGPCLGAEKLEVRKMLENAADWVSEPQANIAHSKRISAGAPQHPVHALLAGFLFCNTLLAVKNSANNHQLPVVIAPARS